MKECVQRRKIYTFIHRQTSNEKWKRTNLEGFEYMRCGKKLIIIVVNWDFFYHLRLCTCTLCRYFFFRPVPSNHTFNSCAPSKWQKSEDKAEKRISMVIMRDKPHSNLLRFDWFCVCECVCVVNSSQNQPMCMKAFKSKSGLRFETYKLPPLYRLSLFASINLYLFILCEYNRLCCIWHWRIERIIAPPIHVSLKLTWRIKNVSLLTI